LEAEGSGGLDHLLPMRRTRLERRADLGMREAAGKILAVAVSILVVICENPG